MALQDYLTGEVAQDFSDGLLNRREAIRRLALLGLSLSGASALLAACGGGDNDESDDVASTTTNPAATPTTAPAIAAQDIRITGPLGPLIAAYAEPESAPDGALLVIHENGGLTPHFRDLVGRFAAEGYVALCVDLLSTIGGTAAQTDPAAIPAALSAAPLEALLADLRAGIDHLEQAAPGVRIGAVGFCFGGAMTWNLLDAGETRLSAAVPFYGPAPEGADFSGTRAAVLAVYAERDTRVNASRDAATAALEEAGLTYEVKTFEGADHAFFNDTAPRYNAEAAKEANEAMLAWFSRYL